jgi:low affinity Fe/Cu permease
LYEDKSIAYSQTRKSCFRSAFPWNDLAEGIKAALNNVRHRAIGTIALIVSFGRCHSMRAGMAKNSDTLSAVMRQISTAVSWSVGHHLTVTLIAATGSGWVLFALVRGFTVEWFLLTNMIGSVGSFLILLAVQHSQRRETLAAQTKLDQLILTSGARNHWIGAQRHEVEVIDQMRSRHHSNF